MPNHTYPPYRAIYLFALTDCIVDGHLNHPLLAQFVTQPSQGESNFGDSSGPLFTMYSKIAEEEDNKMAERWQEDADGIIIFVHPEGTLHSAVYIWPNSQDTSAFYLKEMYQLQASPNISPSSPPSAIAQPPAFSPPTYAVWVNSLWFLSLVISLTCAMLATSLQPGALVRTISSGTFGKFGVSLSDYSIRPA